VRWGNKLPILLILRSVAQRRVSKEAVSALPRIAAMVRDAQAKRPALLTMRRECVAGRGWLIREAAPAPHECRMTGDFSVHSRS